MKIDKVPIKKYERVEKILEYLSSSETSEVEIKLYDEVVVGRVCSLEIDRVADRSFFIIIEPYSMQTRKIPICGEEVIKVTKTKTFKL